MASCEAIETLRTGGAVDFARVFPSGDRVLTCGSEGICVVWEVGSWRAVCSVGLPARHALQRLTLADLYGEGVTAALRDAEVVPPGDGVVILGRGAQARVWDVPSGEERCGLVAAVSVARAFLDGSRLITAAFQSRWAIVWSARSCAVRWELMHEEWLSDVAVLGGLALTVDMRGCIFVWDMGSGMFLRTLHAATVVNGLLPFPDGHRLAAVYRRSVHQRSSRRNVVIWNVTSGVALQNISDVEAESVAVAPAGDILVGCSDFRVGAWDTNTGEELLIGLLSRSVLGQPDRSCFVAMSWGVVLGGGIRAPGWRSLLPP